MRLQDHGVTIRGRRVSKTRAEEIVIGFQQTLQFYATPKKEKSNEKNSIKVSCGGDSLWGRGI